MPGAGATAGPSSWLSQSLSLSLSAGYGRAGGSSFSLTQRCWERTWTACQRTVFPICTHVVDRTFQRVQFPTMSHIGFPLAVSLLVVYPVYHFVGFKRHGFVGYLKHQTVPPGAPWFVLPLLIPIEFFQKFVLNPLTLAIRVFAAMFAGHLLLLVFTLAGEFLLLNGGLTVIVAPVSFAFALALTFLEALIMCLQAYIFALLSASYIGMALAEEH